MPARGRSPVRTIRLLTPPAGAAPGILCLQTGKTAHFYVFHEIRCDIGGRGFAIHRLGLGELYHVRIGRAEDCSCDCMGFLSKGNCKHVHGLLALADHELI